MSPALRLCRVAPNVLLLALPVSVRSGRASSVGRRATLLSRILTALGHPVVRKLVRQLLEAEKGWEVCGEAADGQQVVEQVSLLHPDLVILDFQLPLKNGLVVSRQILETSPSMPILLFSLDTSRALVQQAKTSGVRGIVKTAEASQDLVPAVNALLRGQTFFPSDL